MGKGGRPQGKRKRGPSRGLVRRDGHWHTDAGPVTTTHADGTTSTVPALTPQQLRAIVRDRAAVTEAVRRRVAKRDRDTCRYCGDRVGPFQVDHVVPVALGGSSDMRNLVLACARCNARKGAAVWQPRPRL